MKKAISLLLVLVVSLGLTSIAFAATDIPGTFTFPATGIAIAPRTGAGVPIASPATLTYNIGANELFLVNNNNIIGADTELRPDENYKFDIYHSTTTFTNAPAATILAGAVRKVTKADLGTGTIKVRTVKGSSAIQSAKIRTTGTGAAQSYRLEIDTRPNYGTNITDVEYVLYVVDPTNTAYSFADSTHTFTVGFNTISDSQTDVGEEGTITISNDAPVVTKDQFADIARSANYKNVIFESDDGNWFFKGKVAGMKSSNFSFSYDPDTDLMNKFPEQEFKFLSFPAGVSFPTIGEMRIDVSDVSDDFGTMYAYLYRNGQLTEINGTYDSGADQLVFRTNYLGDFIITNQRITDTSLIPEEEPEVEEEEEEEEYYPPTTHNPGTGAGSANAMTLLGLVALVSAAAVSKKRG